MYNYYSSNITYHVWCSWQLQVAPFDLCEMCYTRRCHPLPTLQKAWQINEGCQNRGGSFHQSVVVKASSPPLCQGLSPWSRPCQCKHPHRRCNHYGYQLSPTLWSHAFWRVGRGWHLCVWHISRRSKRATCSCHENYMHLIAPHENKQPFWLLILKIVTGA